MLKKQKITIALSAIILCGCLAGIYVWHSNQSSTQATATVEQGDMKLLIKETGQVHARQISTYYSDYSQLVSMVAVAVGDPVTAGDLLVAYQTSSDIEATQLQQQLVTLNEQFRLNDQNQQLALADLTTAVNQAKDQLDKVSQLVDLGAASQQDKTAAQTQYQTLSNQLSVAQNQALLAKNTYTTQKNQLNTQLKQLDRAQEQVVITAAFDGIVTELNTQANSMTTAGIPVVEIQNPNDLYIKAELLVEDTLALNQGATVEAKIVNTDVVISDLTLTKIYPKAIATVSTLGVNQKRIPVEIALPAGQHQPPLGCDLDLEILVSEKHQTLILPKTTIFQRNDQHYVLLPDQTEQPVTIGITNNNQVEILEGLEVGQQVLLP